MAARIPLKSMVHLNHHILCATDCETTGLQAGFHEIIQVAFIPLDNNLEIRKDVRPFDVFIKPNYPHRADSKAMSISQVQLSHVLSHGIDSDKAFDLFELWFKSLDLPENKRIVPLAHNWPFESKFYESWMGHENFNTYIDGHYRDLMAAANFLNDRADFNGCGCPFPKRGLQEVCTALNVEVEKPNTHDAVYDSYITAKAYKKILKEFVE